MKRKTFLLNLLTRALAVLVLGALSAVSIFYALGAFEIPFVDRRGGFLPTAPGTQPAGTGTLPTPGTENPATAEPAPGTDVPGADVTGETPGPGPAVTEPTDSRELAALLSSGYKISWADHTPDMLLVEVPVDAEGLNEYDHGNLKPVTLRVPIQYEEGGRMFESFKTEYQTRLSLELYMGYILVDTGIGTADDLFFIETETEDGSVERSRSVHRDVQTVTVFSSTGVRIGIFPASDVVPAYTRDTHDRALFVFDGKYIWLNAETGAFEESDYVDETDNRGLYFDYDPSFGKSDTNLNVFHAPFPVTLTYDLDTESYYTRYGVDERIARTLYEQYPDYARLVAVEFDRGKFYNRPFAIALEQAKKAIKEEALTSTAAPETTRSPETDPIPVTTEPALTEAPLTADTAVVPMPEETLLTPAEETTVPAPAEPPQPVDVSVRAELNAEPVPEGPEIPVGTGVSTDVPTQPASPGNEQTGTSLPETVGPELTVPETAVPETTVPEITVPETTVPETTVPETTVPETTAPETTVPETTVPETTVPETTVPVTTKPETTSAVITVSHTFISERYVYSRYEPVVDMKAVITQYENYDAPYITQRISWPGNYKYAKAYNYREGRAVTYDDNGVMRVINTWGGTVYRRNFVYRSDVAHGATYLLSFFAEPFYRDVSMLGYYYYDNGLMRVRKLEHPTTNINYYVTDEDMLVDLNGETFEIPEGYTLVTYSDGILLLERNGLYGYYHRDGYWIVQPKYTYAQPFVEGMGVIGDKDGVLFSCDTAGQVIIPRERGYTAITNASSGLVACYRPDDGWHVFAKLSK